MVRTTSTSCRSANAAGGGAGTNFFSRGAVNDCAWATPDKMIAKAAQRSTTGASCHRSSALASPLASAAEAVAGAAVALDGEVGGRAAVAVEVDAVLAARA